MAKTAKPDHVLHHSSRYHRSGKRKSVGLVIETQNMTPLRWQGVIEATAHGKDRRGAAKEVGISRRTIDAYLISNISAYSQMREARLLHLRRKWPSERVEKFLMHIARGLTMQRAADKMDVGKKSLSQLYSLFLHDKVFKKMYDEAREMQAETMIDEIKDISDDSGKDRLENGKINHEVVNRSKIRIDTRKFIMGAMHHKRFGEKRQLEHTGEINLNHAALLSGGRRRLEKLNEERAGGSGTNFSKGTKPPPATIDNASGEVAA